MASSFWNFHSDNISKGLWIPGPSSSFVPTFVGTGWCTTKIQKLEEPSPRIFELSQNNFVPEINGNDKIKTIKLLLKPTKEQRTILRKWFNSYRWIYNKALESRKNLEGGQKPPQWKVTMKDWASEDSLSKLLVKDSNVKRIIETPSVLRQQAVWDLRDAYNSAKEKSKKDGKLFELKYKTAKDTSQSMGITSQVIWHFPKMNSVRIFPKVFNEEERRESRKTKTAKIKKEKKGIIRTSKRIRVKKRRWVDAEKPDPGYIKVSWKQVIPPILNDCRLQWLPRLNKFYLCIPFELAPVEDRKPAKFISDENATRYNRIISIDPGVRTFASCYDPRGICFKWGVSDQDRLYRLCCHLDDLISRTDNLCIRAKQRYHMKRAQARIRIRIRNLVDDVHRQFAKWLVSNYDLIILPKFGSSNMVRRERIEGDGKRIYRNIRNKTARMMLTWAHYRFRQRLLYKSRESPGCRVILVDEDYTSKTCGRCGEINSNLKGEEEFKCPQCGIRVDRDANASRNILIRFYTLQANQGEDWIAWYLNPSDQK